jgi:branched-subunit amino acid ABC-type transport system permease component
MSKPSKAARRVMRFVDALIVLCLAMCATVTLTVLYEYHRLSALLGAAEITALLAVWGGELLLIVVRQVLGSDVRGKGNGKGDNDSLGGV